MAEMRSAMQRLRSAQKSSIGAPAYSRYVNRPLGRPLAAVAYVSGWTPTQVTILSGTATGLGILSIALFDPTIWSSLLVTVLLVLGYALDSADGQLARLRGGGTLSGEWLDHFFDALKAATLHAAVLICWFRFYDLDPLWYLVPIAFGVAASAFFFGVTSVDILRRIHHLQHPEDEAASRPGATRTSILYSLAVAPADYGLLCLVFLTLWTPPVFITLYTILTVFNCGLVVASAFRWYRRLRRFESSAG